MVFIHPDVSPVVGGVRWHPFVALVKSIQPVVWVLWWVCTSRESPTSLGPVESVDMFAEALQSHSVTQCLHIYTTIIHVIHVTQFLFLIPNNLRTHSHRSHPTFIASQPRHRTIGSAPRAATCPRWGGWIRRIHGMFREVRLKVHRIVYQMYINIYQHISTYINYIRWFLDEQL